MSYWCISHSATIVMLLLAPWRHRVLQAFFQKHHAVCVQSRETLFWVLASAGSSDPRALDNNRTSYHIIHSPVVLEEQKRDEGREEEGDWKVLVQGSDSGSVGKKNKEQFHYSEVGKSFPVSFILVCFQNKENYLRRQRDISCWYNKYPVRLHQDRWVTCNNSESNYKLSWSGTSCSPNTNNLNGEVQTVLTCSSQRNVHSLY